MDPNTAVVLVAAIGALGSIAAAVIAAWAAVQSAANGRKLTDLVPTVALLEKNTNSMTTEIARLAKKEGEQIGELRGAKTATDLGNARAEALKEGQAQPQTPAPAPAKPAIHESASGGEEIKLDDVDSLKLKT